MHQLFSALVLAGTLALQGVLMGAIVTPQPVTRMTATLAPVGRGSVAGNANLTASGQTTTLVLTAYHLSGRRAYVEAIFPGRCGAGESRVASFPPKSTQTDSTGILSLTYTYRGHLVAAGKPLTTPFHIDVYAGSTVQAHARPLACGLITSIDAGPTIKRVARNLAAQIYPVGRSKVNGSAGILVSSSTNKTILLLSLFDLNPGASYAVAFRIGQCGNNTSTFFPFPVGSVRASAVGAVHTTDVYRAVLRLPHQPLRLDIYQGVTIVACGKVVDITPPPAQ